MNDDDIRRYLMRLDSGTFEAVAANDEDGIGADAEDVAETDRIDKGFRFPVSVEEKRSQFRAEMNES